MTFKLEDRIREALAEDARTYRAPAGLWEGVVEGVRRPHWRRRPRRSAFVAAAVAAAVAGAVLVWPGGARHSVTVGPASGTAPTAPTTTTMPPQRPLPSWAYPFLATKEGSKELFLVTESGTRVLAGDPASDMVYGPIGLAGDHAVFTRRPLDEVFAPELVVAPINGGREQTADVTGAALSPDRGRIVYVTRSGRAPVEVVVRDVASGDELRLPIGGSPFAQQPLVLMPDLVGDTLLLEYMGEGSSSQDGVWALDLRTATSARDARRWPTGIANLGAYDGGHVLAERFREGVDEREHVVVDVRTGQVVRTLVDVGDVLFVFSDGRGHLAGAGDGLQVYDGDDWTPVPGYEFAAW